MANYKRITNMTIDELHDLIHSLSKDIQAHVRTGTRAFHNAMDADTKKEKAEARLSELEDFPTKHPSKKNVTFPPEF